MDIRLFLRGTLMASVVFFPSYSFSQEAAVGEIFEVSTPETVQNGAAGRVLDGGDTLFVTDEGSIDIIDFDQSVATVLVSGGANNVIRNEGLLAKTREGVNPNYLKSILIDIILASTDTTIENFGAMDVAATDSATTLANVSSLQSTGNLTVINYATGEMSVDNDDTGGSATGIEYSGSGDLAFTNAGTLFVKAHSFDDRYASRAIFFAGRDLDIDVSGSVTVENNELHGQVSFAVIEDLVHNVIIPGERNINISGSVDLHAVDGAKLLGLESKAANVTMDISGSFIATSEGGSSDLGIRSIASNFALNISSSGKLSIESGNIHGVSGLASDGADLSVNSAGIISASTIGNSSVAGIKSTGARAVVNNSGSLSATAGSITERNPNISSIYSSGLDAQLLNEGSIVASVASAESTTIVHGIYSIGDGATISNSGSIDVSVAASGGVGMVVAGILAERNAIAERHVAISNSGKLIANLTGSGNGEVSGINAHEISADISNSGSISASTTGTGTVFGIYSRVNAPVAGAKTTISNSGSIDVSAAGNNVGMGINVWNMSADISNSGVISVSTIGTGKTIGIIFYVTNADVAAADAAGVTASLTNSGIISVLARGTGEITGVAFANGGSLVNSGTITASRTVEQANGLSYVVGGRGAITISNSGSITGSIKNNIAAISLLDGGSLEFRKGSFIVGEMLLGGDTSISIDGDQANSLHYVFGGAGGIVVDKPQVSGSSPVFYNADNREVAILDTSNLNAGIDALEGMSSNVSDLIRSRRFVQDDSKSHVWVSGAVSRRASGENVSFFTADDEIKDFSVGVDGVSFAGLSIGGLVGANTSNMVKSGGHDMPSSYQRESTGMFGAVYAIRHFDRVFLQTAVSGGFLKHNDERFIQDNTVDSGIDVARSSYHSYWYSPEVTLGVGISASDWTYTPSVNLRYAHQLVDAYRETGSKSNVNYDSHSISLLSGRAGLAADRQFSSAHLTLRAGLQSFGLIGGSNDVSFSMLDNPEQTFLIQSGKKRGIYGGVDVAMKLSQNASIILGGEVLFSKNKKVDTHLSAGLDIAF